MIKAKFSNKYWAVLKRIQRLPKYTGDMADTITRKDAEGLVEEYKDGIRNNNFNLKPLSSKTIRAKMAQGYSKPSVPLYGAGDSEKNSLINTFKIRKVKKGYRVFMSWGKHHVADLPLRVLFKIHEEGCVIDNGFGKGILIRIPPRPTKVKAFKRFIAKKLREENVEKARKIIIRYLRTGSIRKLK